MEILVAVALRLEERHITQIISAAQLARRLCGRTIFQVMGRIFSVNLIFRYLVSHAMGLYLLNF